MPTIGGAQRKWTGGGGGRGADKKDTCVCMIKHIHDVDRLVINLAVLR
jgi:hypothetical protein